MIIYVSEFSGKSGYDSLSRQLCFELVQKNIDVMALGVHYERTPHNLPYSLVPVDKPGHVPAIITNLKQQKIPIEAIIVALDIPIQIKLFKEDKLSHKTNVPYIGLFPLEAVPLSTRWALDMQGMDKALVMTKFGTEELLKCGINAEFIPLTPPKKMGKPSPDERNHLRGELDIDQDTFVVLMVAANQERKNMDAAIKAFGKFSVIVKDRNKSGFATDVESIRKTELKIVTDPNTPWGWDLQDLANREGVGDRLRIYKDISSIALQTLYGVSDCLLVSSKAEGLIIPMLEAYQMGLPVIGTNCTAIAEHGADNRALLADVSHTVRGTFGNGERYYVDPDSLAEKLGLIYHDQLPDVQKAYDYVVQREGLASDIVIKSLDELGVINNG